MYCPYYMSDTNQSVYSYTSPVDWYFYYSHFIDEETEWWRGLIICSHSHRKYVAEPGLEIRGHMLHPHTMFSVLV